MKRHRVSSVGKCPTHMPSHMGPSYFVAGVRGVPSEVKYLGTALSLLQASDFFFFLITPFLKAQVGEVVMHK